MDKPEKKRRARRKFPPQFKKDAVQLCKAGDRSVAKVAADLDLTETALRHWVRQAEIDTGAGPPDVLTTDERTEFARLRRENKRLQMERDILKKATAFFAREST